MSKTLVVVCFAVVLAACGGGDGAAGDGVASIDDLATTSVAPGPAEESAAAGGGDEAAVLEFAGCMRSGGIDFPDPELDSDGNVGFDLEALRDLAEVDEEELESAFEECIGLLEGVSFGFEQIFEAEFQDAILEFAVCMRANGFDMPDPDFSQLTTTGQIFGEQLDINDPDFEAAFELCQDTLPGIPGIAEG